VGDFHEFIAELRKFIPQGRAKLALLVIRFHVFSIIFRVVGTYSTRVFSCAQIAKVVK